MKIPEQPSGCEDFETRTTQKAPLEIIFRLWEEHLSSERKENSGQTFVLVNSIKNAGLNSIAILSYIIFFSGVTSLVRALTKNNILTAYSAIIFEISGAVTQISNLNATDLRMRLSLTAFALSFSGLSVHLQAFSFLPKEIGKTRYFIAKLSQAILSFIAASFMFR